MSAFNLFQQPVPNNVDRRSSPVNIVRNNQNRIGATTPAPQPWPTPSIVNDYQEYLYFTAPIFMGLIVGLFIVVTGLIGVYALFVIENPDRFASVTDKCLTVPLA